MVLFRWVALSALLLAISQLENEAEAFAPSIGSSRGRTIHQHVQDPLLSSPERLTGKRVGSALYMSSRQQTGRDFYSILGVSRDASTAEIKVAYRKMVSIVLEGDQLWIYFYVIYYLTYLVYLVDSKFSIR